MAEDCVWEKTVAVLALIPLRMMVTRVKLRASEPLPTVHGDNRCKVRSHPGCLDT